MDNLRKNSSGFTLVELLVVVAIVTIMAALIPVSYRFVISKSKDTVRKNDLKQYQISLENYASSNEGLYPLQTNTVRASTSLCMLLGSYLEKCLEDYKYASDQTYTYYYQSSLNGLTYVLWAKTDNGDKTWVQCGNKNNGEISSSNITVENGVCPLGL